MSEKEPMLEKCNEERMCTLLSDRADEPCHQGKGFVPVYINRRNSAENMKRIFHGVKFKQARGDNGLLINFCPFCGDTPGILHK